MGDADANLVKVLRSKCNDLEDQLDVAKEAKEAAEADKEALDDQVGALRQELLALKENRKPPENDISTQGGDSAEGIGAAEGPAAGQSTEAAVETLPAEPEEPKAGSADVAESNSKKKKKKSKKKQGSDDAAKQEAQQDIAGQETQPDTIASPEPEVEGKPGGQVPSSLNTQEVAECKIELRALQATLAEELARHVELQRKFDELEAEASEFQGKVDEAEEAEEEAQEEVSQANKQFSSAQAARIAAVERAEEAHTLLREERARLGSRKEARSDECVDLLSACEEASKAALAAEETNASMDADASSRESRCAEREAALKRGADEETAGMEAMLAAEERSFTQLQQERDSLETSTQRLDQQIHETTALAGDLQERVSKATEELRATKAATNDATVRFVQAEEELTKVRTRTATAEATCKELSAERNSATGRTQQAERIIVELELRLETLRQQRENQESTLSSEGESRIAKLRVSVEEEEGQLAELQEEQQQLHTLQKKLQEQIETMSSSHEEVQLEWSKFDTGFRAARDASESASKAAELKEAELAEEQGRSKHLLDLCVQLSAELRRLQGIEDAEEVMTLEEQLHEARRARAAWTDSHQELNQQCKDHVEAIDKHRQDKEDLAAETERERESRGAELSSFHDLQQQHADLDFERCQRVERSDTLSAQLEEERWCRTDGAAKHEQLQVVSADLQQKHTEATNEVSQLAEKLAEEQQLCSAGSLKHSEILAQLEELHARTNACAETHRQASASLASATAEQATVAQRAGHLQVKLDAVKPAQQELENKCNVAMEQLDALRCVNEEIVLEKERLQSALAQEREAAEQARREHEETKKALEAAGPSKLSVGDVLISVAFHGVPQPLEMMPWDGDLEAVVSNWLEATQRSSRLHSSLVRYLSHLEETASTFPVRVEASLLEVHEEFAV